MSGYLTQFASDALNSWFLSMVVVSIVLMFIFTFDECGSALRRSRKRTHNAVHRFNPPSDLPAR
jgi:hypothetical protein